MGSYDVVVIGSGPGGYVAAVRASRLGLKTALVEKDQLGGICVNWGCIPTKALLRNAEMVHLMSQKKTFGIQFDNLSVDYIAAHKRSRQVAKRQGKRVEALLKKYNVSIFHGEAHLTSQTEVEILPAGERLMAKNIILATGAKPRSIPGIEIDGDKIIAFHEALELTEPPSSIIIVGAGPIGMEFATVWSRYGSDVTVLEMMPNILPLADEDVSKEAKACFQKEGIKIKTGARVQNLVRTTEGVEATILTGDGEETLVADKVLIAIGFAPNSANLGLEQAGIAVDNSGRVEVDAQMRTSLPNIFAIGDLNGKLDLAHVASAQGIIAANAIAGRKTHELVYENIPSCVFGSVEVASAGLTEKQAKHYGHEIITIKSPFAPNGKAIALNENVGFIKLVANAKSRKLLGVHMIGSNVTELIAGPAGMIALGLTIDQITEVVYPHPTLSEAFLEGIHGLAGSAIHL